MEAVEESGVAADDRPHTALRSPLRAGVSCRGARAAWRADPSARQAQRRALDRETARRIELDPVLHGRPRYRRHAMDRALQDLPGLCAEDGDARHRQRGRALRGGQFRERRHRQHRLQLGMAGRADERLPLVARNRRHQIRHLSRLRRPGFLHRGRQRHQRRRHASVARDQRAHRRRPGRRARPFHQGEPVGQTLSAALSRGVRRDSGAGCAGAIGKNRASRRCGCADRSALLPNG